MPEQADNAKEEDDRIEHKLGYVQPADIAREEPVIDDRTAFSDETVADGGAPASRLTIYHDQQARGTTEAAETQVVGNVPIDDMYEHVVKNKVPIEEWPHFIYERVSAVA